MQTFGLPRQMTRGDAVRRWQGARRQGLSAADAAAAVGVSRATLYRWAKRAEPRSRRPRRPRRPRWTPAPVAAVQRVRGDCPQVGPMWGKARIAILLRRDGHETSESTVGRILKTSMERGAVTPARAATGPAPPGAPGPTPDACPRDAKPAPQARSSNSTPSPSPPTPAGPPSSGSPPATPSRSGPAPGPGAAPPHTTPRFAGPARPHRGHGPGPPSTSSRPACPFPHRAHRPVDRRLRRRARRLPTAPGPWRTNPSPVPCRTRGRRIPSIS